MRFILFQPTSWIRLGHITRWNVQLYIHIIAIYASSIILSTKLIDFYYCNFNRPNITPRWIHPRRKLLVNPILPRPIKSLRSTTAIQRPPTVGDIWLTIISLLWYEQCKLMQIHNFNFLTSNLYTSILTILQWKTLDEKKKHFFGVKPAAESAEQTEGESEGIRDIHLFKYCAEWHFFLK